MSEGFIWLNRPNLHKNLRVNPGLRHISRLHVKPSPYCRTAIKNYSDKHPDAQIKLVCNFPDNHEQALAILLGCRQVYHKQLPNMEIEYITRHVYEHHCLTVTVLQHGEVVGAITSRIFVEENFLEIVFVSVLSDFQNLKFGRLVMMYLKTVMQAYEIPDAITCADNDAVKFFTKQGFNTKEILMDPVRWLKRIKDYRGVTTSHLQIDPSVDYFTFDTVLRKQMKDLEQRIGKVYHSVPEILLNRAWPKGPGFVSIPLPKMFEMVKNNHTDDEAVQEICDQYDNNMELYKKQFYEILSSLEQEEDIVESCKYSDAALEKITNYVDFLTIRRRLERTPDYYKSQEMFFKDLTQICENMKFDKANYRSANKLQNAIKKLRNKLNNHESGI